MTLDETARQYSAVMLANGREPLVVVGGMLDGLRFFPREIDGVEYLVSEIGLLDPADVRHADERIGPDR